jgi:hypothetical protein
MHFSAQHKAIAHFLQQKTVKIVKIYFTTKFAATLFLLYKLIISLSHSWT